MNIGPAFLGVPKAVSGMLSAEGKDIASIMVVAFGLLDSEFLEFQTLEHMMRNNTRNENTKPQIKMKQETKYGRTVSFGKTALTSYDLQQEPMDAKKASNLGANCGEDSEQEANSTSMVQNKMK
ncbi:hypothetical protein L1887_05323 [Cichorium endivia]|nr:hypothetical protein L1887_05323 [Cichorium endivia]